MPTRRPRDTKMESDEEKELAPGKEGADASSEKRKPAGDREDYVLIEVPFIHLLNTGGLTLSFDLTDRHGKVVVARENFISRPELEELKEKYVRLFRKIPRSMLPQKVEDRVRHQESERQSKAARPAATRAAEEEIRPPILDPADVARLTTETKQVFSRIRDSGVLEKAGWEHSRRMFATIFDQLSKDFSLEGRLDLAREMAALDSTTYAHSVNTGCLAMIFGMRLKIPKEELLDWVQSAYYFDVGKNRVSEEVLNKKETLTAWERQALRSHSRLGYQIIQKYSSEHPEDMSAVQAKLTALLHHIRYDGKGYPQKNELETLGGLPVGYGSLPQFTKMIAVCDTYAALTEPRAYREAHTPRQALRTILNQGYGAFDLTCVYDFLRHLGRPLNNHQNFYDEGEFVILITVNEHARTRQARHEIARVLEVHPQDPLHPVVEILAEIESGRRIPRHRVDLARDFTRQLFRIVDNPQALLKVKKYFEKK